jgi:hypothetical protein
MFSKRAKMPQNQWKSANMRSTELGGMMNLEQGHDVFYLLAGGCGGPRS